MRSLGPLAAACGLAVIAAAGLGCAPADAADPALVASSCTGCHAASGKLSTAIPTIRGQPEAFLFEAMRAFRAGQRPATVMDRIAKGFTDEEIRQLAAYFAALK